MNYFTAQFARQMARPLVRSYSTRFTQQTFPSFTRSWLSDPSVYPLVVILSFTLTMMAGAGIHSLTSPSVKLLPSKRHSYSCDEPSPSIVSKLARPIQPEGLGIDHEEWKKSKGL